MDGIIYFDNAATSFPKPASVLEAMEVFYREQGGNPGRSGHRLSIAAGEKVEEARELVARLFNVPDPFRIAFTYNASYALNMAVWGVLQPEDRVLTTPLEHNSISRPLRLAEKRMGIKLEFIKTDPATGLVDLEDLRHKLKKKTRLVCVVHGSNVSGTVQPLDEIARLTREQDSLLLVDAAQTAGTYPIDLSVTPVDLLAFTGHKGMFGPMGTGGLYVRPGIDLDFMFAGGTGSKSELDTQPDFMPDRLEAGTPNAGGLAGLAAGVSFVLEKGVDSIHQTETQLARTLIEGLESIDGVRVIAAGVEERLPVVSFTVKDMTVSDVGWKLDEEFGILCRVGLHCSPWAHTTFGTFPEGTVRFSLSIFNTMEEVHKAIEAVRKIAAGR